MIPEGDPDLITYLTELLTTKKPDQQNNTFWFPTPENPGNIEDDTPIQTRILKEFPELQLKKLNPKDDMESRMDFESNLIGQTHCSQKLKTKKWKLFWLTDMTYLLDKEWISG